MIAGTDGALLAALIAEAGRGPSGSADLADYTGQVLAWDELSGTNVVRVNGAEIPNMRVVVSGIGTTYRAGDVVNVLRRGTQWFVLGRITAPGAGAGSQIDSDDVINSDPAPAPGAGWGEVATPGPAVTVRIGSTRRCLVLYSCIVQVIGYIGDDPATLNKRGSAGMSFEVSGASAFPAGAHGAAEFLGGPYNSVSVSSTRLLTAEDGLNPGLATFTARYRSVLRDEGIDNFVGWRTLTVIPF